MRRQPHGVDDRAEVVLEQHQRRGLARDVGAAAPHRDADVRGLQCRRVVHAVPGHRHHLARGLVRGDEPQLLARQDAREHAYLSHRLRERRVIHRLDLGAGEDALVSEAGLARDLERRAGKVAGDHHHADAGAAALRHGIGHRRAQRVGEHEQADEAERIAPRVLERRARPRRFGHAKQAQATRSSALHVADQVHTVA